MSEAQFQAKVIRFLKEEGAWVIKYWGGGRFTRAGVPDLLCCVAGRFVAVELKTDIGRATPLQIHSLEEIIQAGGRSFLLRPDGFEAFKRAIREVKACNIPIPESAPSSNVDVASNFNISISSGPSQTSPRTMR